MSLLVFIALLFGTAAWFLLPLLPALLEMYRPSDAEPLTMVGQDAGDLTVFAEGFRQYLHRQAPEILGGTVTPGVTEARLADGTPVIHVNGRPEVLAAAANADRLVPRLVVAHDAVRLPGGETFLLELYARGAMTGGPGAVYRAILGEDDVVLGEDSVVLRWVHAEKNLVVGRGSQLSSRASANAMVYLGPSVRFARVQGTRVVVGETEPPLPEELPPVIAGTMKLPRSARQERGFIRVRGDLEVPAGASLLGTVVVTGSLRLGAEARISGNAKVHGACELAPGAIVDGSLVCRGDVHLSAGARVLGPIVTDGVAVVDAGCTIGGPQHPATLAAAEIVCDTGVQVFGAIMARTRGRTAAASGAKERLAS